MTPDVPGKGPVDETMRARVHAIAQEAYRRRLEQTHPGHDIDAPTVILAIEIALSGWTPPEPEPEVDPDVLAFREWLATSPWHPGSDRDEADLHPAYRPDGMLCQTYLAGARMAREQMPSLTDAVEWIAENNDEDLGNHDDGYQIIVELVAALFDRQPHDVVYAVTLQRAGCFWSLDDIRALDPAAPANNTGEKRDD